MTFEQWLKETGYNTLYTSVIHAMELAWNAAKQHGYTGRGGGDHRDMTTQNGHTRFADKGPLPPPVVDFSTDQCPTCGEVLNQCKCPQVLQRVDFGDEELETEVKRLNKSFRRLEELLYEIAISGVEHDDERLDYVTVQIDRITWNELQEVRE